MAMTEETEETEETEGGNDNTLLIATDDGKIYRLVEERWRLPDFELGGDAAAFLKERLLDNGVITAHLPLNLIDPFFACYLINLAMIKQAPTQTPEPEPEPTGGETPCGTGEKK